MWLNNDRSRKVHYFRTIECSSLTGGGGSGLTKCSNFPDSGDTKSVILSAAQVFIMAARTGQYVCRCGERMAEFFILKAFPRNGL